MSEGLSFLERVESPVLTISNHAEHTHLLSVEGARVGHLKAVLLEPSGLLGKCVRDRKCCDLLCGASRNVSFRCCCQSRAAYFLCAVAGFWACWELHLASPLYKRTFQNSTSPVLPEVMRLVSLLLETKCVDHSGTCRRSSSCSQGRTYREPSAAFCTFALEPLGLGPKSSTGGLRGWGAQCGEEGGLLRPCSWCSLVGTRLPDVPASLGTRMCSSRCFLSRRSWQPLAGGAPRSRSRVGWADTASYPELYHRLW